MKNNTNPMYFNEFAFSLALNKDRAIARSRSSNFTIAITLRSFLQVTIGDHLAIAKKRSPIRSPIARSAIVLPFRPKLKIVSKGFDSFVSSWFFRNCATFANVTHQKCYKCNQGYTFHFLEFRFSNDNI